MEFTIVKRETKYQILENSKLIFTADFTYENKLLCVYLRNLYGDEVFGCYQIKKWYNYVKTDIALSFTIYHENEKLGELHKHNNGFELNFHGLRYRYFGGSHAGIHTIICFDRDLQIGEIQYLNEKATIRFTHESLGALHAMMAVLFFDFIKAKSFKRFGFINKYQGTFIENES